MAETNPSLHIDTDWKKQAQEEKRRLAEQEQQKTGPAPIDPGEAAQTPAATAEGPAADAPREARGGRKPAGEARSRELPPASFPTLVQTLVTQALFYLGGIATRGGEPVVDLDLAKHQIDLLGVLEEKSANNLTPEEKRLLDAALYETRMRYISVASQYIS